jgi:DNA polymerase-3 subunit delta'
MFFGHEDKIEVFRKLVKNDALGHAYLFFGEPQVGKFLFAKLLAAFLETNDFRISDRPLVDSKIFAPQENGVIGVADVAEIKKFLWQTPFNSPRRLAIINDAETLTDEAQAACLKIIEEPPAHATIIFIAADPQVFLPPLASRLQKIYFSRLTTNQIKNILVQRYRLTEPRAAAIAGISFGRIGRVLNLIANPKKEESSDVAKEIEETIVNLRTKDLRGNSKILAWLLAKETYLKRYNLNPNLQKKAIAYKLHG